MPVGSLLTDLILLLLFYVHFLMSFISNFLPIILVLFGQPPKEAQGGSEKERGRGSGLVGRTGVGE